VECLPCFDTARLDFPVPAGYQCCLVYMGGSSATHAWDREELAKVAHLRRLPVWVPTPGQDHPGDVALQVVAWLRRNKVPPGRHVLWDMETGKEPDPAWLNMAAGRVAKAGFRNLTYGSMSVVFGNPQRDGYFVANPTGHPHMVSRIGVKGTQYAFDIAVPGGTIDQSLISTDLAHELWLPA